MILAKCIIPTFNRSDITLQENNNIFILGNFTFDNDKNRFLTTGKSINNHIILGPNSFVLFNNFPAITQSTSDVYYIYPGCTVKDNVNDTYNVSNLILRPFGLLYLNRYINSISTNLLQGTISIDMKIIYANVNLKSDTNNKYTYTDCFPNLYWAEPATMHKKADSLRAMSKKNYFIQEPELPLEFIEDPNNGSKKVLSIKDDVAARCDVTFWDQCSPDNKKYGLQAYNKINNRDKYIDLNTLENLFYNGKDYNTNGLLQNMPNEIFVGLIGNKNIVIVNNTENKEVILLGNNSGYTGTMTIPDSINDVYLKKLSIIPNGIISNSKTYTITIDESNNISYKVNNTSIEPEDLELKFHFIDIDLLPQLKDLEDKLTQAQSNLETANKTTEEINTELTNANKAKDEIQKQLDNTTSELTNTKNNKRLVEEELEKVKKELEGLIKQQNSNTTTTSQVKPAIKPSKSVSTQTEGGSIKFHSSEFDLKYDNKITIDLKNEDYDNNAIILKDTGLIQNSILWLTGDNRDFKGIIITPKYIKKVIFYPNSFVKVINPTGRKLKYVFVSKDGNIDKEYYYNSDDEYKEDGKYLWELCKDGKFRKYYIENYNK